MDWLARLSEHQDIVAGQRMKLPGLTTRVSFISSAESAEASPCALRASGDLALRIHPRPYGRGLLRRRIKAKGKFILAIEVPTYQVIKTLLASAKSSPEYKFEILYMPPGAKQAGPWKLPAYFKKPRLRKRTVHTP